jgi:diguanylate cyclase (GGDEF)-like protein
MVEERIKREKEVVRSLKEQQLLYNIGIMLTSSEKEDELLNTIVDHAMQLTGTPAGSIALYDEVEGCMEMVASSGFSSDFSGKSRWKVARSGLTEHILNKNASVVIDDLSDYKEIDRPDIANEGIKALIATPLVAERKTIGILYVDDFSPREFTKKDESILALLATQAATAIEKMQLLEKTKKLAITDELTSLYNHRHFVHLFKEEIKRSRRYDRPLSVMLIDIDHFKNYNDTHGHIKGNEVLKKFSAVMADSVRDIDLVARYGGEEFGIILPETGKDYALECAERIREAVEKFKFNGEEKQPLGLLTASIGIATFPDDAKREDTLLDRADVALYQAKKEGRNRVVGYGNIE